LTEGLYRNEFQIMKDILLVAQSGALLTHLYYKANSNYRHVKGYVDRALKARLLRQDGHRFYTTDKGKEFILHVLNLESMLVRE